MSDPCSGPFLQCANPTIVTRDISASYNNSYSHFIDRVLTGSWAGVSLNFLRTTRNFSLSYQMNREERIDKVILNMASTEPSIIDCKNPNAQYHHTVSESCQIEVGTLLYYDPFYEVLLFKKDRQEINFTVSSDETAVFRGKWGNTTHHKLVIRNADIHCSGSEEFHLYWRENGEMQHRILHTGSYDIAPMPEASGMGTWGLYGAQILKSCPEAKQDVAMILVVPQPASLAIPLDCDINQWGFYDYLAKEEGFSTTDLALQDGGMDFFYPEWCRNMLADSIWRAEADARYAAAWGPPPRPALVPVADYTVPTPACVQTPCGNCVNVARYGTFWSFVIDTRAGVKVFNELRLPDTSGTIQVSDPSSLLGAVIPLRAVTYYPSIGLK